MKLILLSHSGKSHVVRLSRRSLTGVAVVAGSLFVLGCAMAFQLYVSGPLDQSLVADWRREITAQQTEVRSLEATAEAESQAVGKQLAAMQARLLRMEALGSRVAEVAALDDGEFSFDESPATGGPEAAVRPLAGFELQDALADLSLNLKRREAELEVLENLLRDREFREATEVAGRPVARGWLSSTFGRRVDPFSGNSAWHAGLDFSARPGTEVLAAGDGVVIYAAYRQDYGNTVEINHGDGFVSRYAHQKELKVAVGDVVKRGQVIGAVGSSGRASGPHLHFEVLKNGQPVNPQRYIARR